MKKVRTSPIPKFVDVAEFSSISGVRRTVIKRLLARGKLQAVKISGVTLINLEQGLAWVASRPPAELFGARGEARPKPQQWQQQQQQAAAHSRLVDEVFGSQADGCS
jgi:hypothetical protein